MRSTPSAAVKGAWRRLPVVLLVAVLAHASWRFAHDTWLTVRSPWSRDYGEGCVLAAGQLLAEHGSYFPRPESYPYFIANYPPLFVSLVALGHVLFGPSLLFPRLLGLLSTLGLLAVLFRALRAAAVDAATAAALALLFAAPWFVTTWAALARVDTLAIALALAGLGVALRHGPTRRAWPAALLFGLAFFTKQNAVAAPAALALDLALARDRRLGRALLALVLPAGALAGALVLATRGEAFRHLVVFTAAAEYEPGRMGASYAQFAFVAAPLLVIVAAALVAAPRAFARGTGRVLLLYFGIALALLSTIAKAGAAQNYFLEPWAATLLLAGYSLHVLAARSAAVRAWRFALLLAAAACASHAFPSLYRLPQALRRPQNADEFHALTRLVRTTPGDVLSENLSLLVVNRRRVLVEPFGVLLVARQGLLSTERLARDCEAGRFPLVIVEHRFWEIPGLGACLERRYAPAFDLGPYQALQPKGSRAAPAAISVR